MSKSYNLHPTEEHEDKSFGYQLDSEIEAKKAPALELPGGVRYVADTRRQSHEASSSRSSVSSQKGGGRDRSSICSLLEDTRCDIRTRGYLPIENYGIIGNLRTVALCGTDGSMDFFCYPKFDSPSIFCRLLDKDKGGHFSVTPVNYTSNKQQYLPNSNILTTRFMSNDGVSEITDYMHLPERRQSLTKKPLLPWVIRSVRVIRGTVDFKMECFPSFNYGQSSHTAEIQTLDPALLQEKLNETMQSQDDSVKSESSPQAAVFVADNPGFKSSDLNGTDGKQLKMDLRFLSNCGEYECPLIRLCVDKDATELGFKGPGVVSSFALEEGQQVTFIFREIPPERQPNETPKCRLMRLAYDPPLTVDLMEALFRQTAMYWQKWIGSSTYNGRWRENVMRSALTLKLLTYEPTGAVVAAPTFGIPEAIGGERNWDYRYVWIRDSSFTIYAFLRLGFTEEARKYLEYIENRCNDLNEDGSLNIMYSIDGAKELEEYELDHFEGYRSSRPVRVGNGAYDHLQLDIYGELMDGIYLYNKYGSPVSYDIWCIVRKLANYVINHWELPDMSIWEVRSSKQRFTYSMIMCWVALDRALRLSEKRQFPCFERDTWRTTRDTIYELIQTKCYNEKYKMYTQSIETPDAVDASCLIMPLVFFSSPTDPRMLNTIQRILLPPKKVD
ncbi:unnamed protein product [Absidia cylindrospora]